MLPPCPPPAAAKAAHITVAQALRTGILGAVLLGAGAAAGAASAAWERVPAAQAWMMPGAAWGWQAGDGHQSSGNSGYPWQPGGDRHPQPVPEPSTVYLLLVGAIGVAAARSIWRHFGG